MNIQIEFKKIEQISAGLTRDQLIATVRNSTFFFSSETLQYIPAQTSDQIKVPKMMPNTEFTRFFSSFSIEVGHLTSAALVGNFTINLILKSAMSVLWSLLHSMQIIAFFPLVNISMPANAFLLFKVLIKIATLDILPTEELIDGVKDGLGISSDEYVLTDDFFIFGYESTSPIDNLQLKFIALVGLIVLPLLLSLVRVLFCRCRCTNGCIGWIRKRIFFNTYIRFGLEAYLELALSSLLRLKNFRFINASENFHSIFSLMTLLTIVSFMVFTLIFLQKRFLTLQQEESK